MKLRTPEARALIAAEYVLGTLRGKARARFELWLRSDPRLRAEVNAWQSRLSPLSQSAPSVAPRDAVWTAIEARINPSRQVAQSGWFGTLAFWRWSSVLSATAAVLLFGFIALNPRQALVEGDSMMVAVMEDESSSPKITVAWSTDEKARPRLRLRVIGHQTMEKGTAWELWMLPDSDQGPRSLGLITTHETQYVDVPRELWPAVLKAAGLAMSVEPEKGSPTGKPTGPVLYKGKCLTI